MGTSVFGQLGWVMGLGGGWGGVVEGGGGGDQNGV